MKKKRISYGDSIFWTLSSLMHVLHKMSLDGVSGDTVVLIDGCGCCNGFDEGGVSIYNSHTEKYKKVITIRKTAGFEDGDEREQSRALDEFADEQLEK